MEKTIDKYLNDLIDSQITYSRAGGGAGPIISMELNKENMQYALWIECDWRIENKIENKIVATSTDNIKPKTGLLAKSVKMLEGKTIESIKLSSYNDLIINFKDGLCLNIFCIFSQSSEFQTNWYLAILEENLVYEITNQFNVKIGKYN